MNCFANDATYIIAEAGSNFDGKLSQCKDLIEVAAESGADAVKFQLFRADVLYPDVTQPVHSRVKACELPREWVGELNRYAINCGLDFLATPFDCEAIDLLESIDIRAYKWGSSETTNHLLLLKAARTKKPIFLSTGMCSMADVAEAIEILDENGCPSVNVLHCVAVYPTDPADANLLAIKTLKEAYHKPIGFSDHSLGITLPIAAVALGAKIIEKHFTLDRQLEGPDHSYALEPKELKAMISSIRDVELSLGSGQKSMHPEERAWGRRNGIYLNKDLPKGHVLSREDLEIKRPATSIPSRYAQSIIGSRLLLEMKSGQAVNWKDIE